MPSYPSLLAFLARSNAPNNTITPRTTSPNSHFIGVEMSDPVNAVDGGVPGGTVIVDVGGDGGYVDDPLAIAIVGNDTNANTIIETIVLRMLSPPFQHICQS